MHNLKVGSKVKLKGPGYTDSVIEWFGVGVVETIMGENVRVISPAFKTGIFLSASQLAIVSRKVENK